MMDKNRHIEEMGNEIQKAVNGCASYWSRLIAYEAEELKKKYIQSEDEG